LKKRTKKLLLLQAGAMGSGVKPMEKSLLLLFFRKEVLPSRD
jgi:hypothetical protein